MLFKTDSQPDLEASEAEVSNHPFGLQSSLITPNSFEETIWIIGEHSIVDFWKSNWLGFIIASKVDNKMKVDWDGKISDYFQNGCWTLPQVFQDRFADIANEVKKIDIQKGHIDKLIWKINLHGEVTSKNAFDELRESAPKVRWGKWIWAAFIPPRKSILVWRIIHNAIPTIDNIRRRGIPLPSACTFCLRSGDNTDHIFTECHISKLIWQHFFNIINLKLDLNGGFNALLIQIMSLKLSPSLLAIVKSLFMATAWIIWESRNKFLHEGQHPYIKGMISSIWSSIHDLKHFKLKGFNGSQMELQIAKTFQIPFNCVHSLRVKEVNWSFPPPSWVKINVDGSAKGAPGYMTSGGVFRNFRGFFKGCFVADMLVMQLKLKSGQQ